MSDKLHFQVVSLDKHDYINVYRNFQMNESAMMLQYIEFLTHQPECQIIKISRWNEKGEKE